MIALTSTSSHMQQPTESSAQKKQGQNISPYVPSSVEDHDLESLSYTKKKTIL